MNISKIIVGALFSLVLISGIYAATNITNNTTVKDINCLCNETCTGENCLCNETCTGEKHCYKAQNRCHQNNNGEFRKHSHRYGANRRFCHN